MTELLKNAWQGWYDYIALGKYAALLLAVLLYLYLFRGKECGESCDRRLLHYTAAGTVCCIFPLTAVLLMLYQTRFYDYQWIWSLVPVTIVIAWGGILFLSEQKGKKKGLLAALLTVVILLSGGIGRPDYIFADKDSRGTAGAVLAAVTEHFEEETPEEAPVLWAPREILECARASKPGIVLLYGRNLWDKALNAYVYETYGEREEDLYRWMSFAEEFGSLNCDSAEGRVIEGVYCMKEALAAGVNCILLPGCMQEEALEVLGEVLDAEPKELDGYYLFIL